MRLTTAMVDTLAVLVTERELSAVVLEEAAIPTSEWITVHYQLRDRPVAQILNTAGELLVEEGEQDA